MNRTFRLRRSILIQGIGFLLIYLTVTIGGAVVLLLIKEPQTQGFKDAESVKIMFGMWVSVFGTMTVLSVYMLIAYCMERLSIKDQRIHVRSVFQNRHFEATEVDRLVWKTTPKGGKLTFYVSGQKTAMHFNGFRREDRLPIIRVLRDLIPEGKQDGWPLFCSKIALPLRDGVQAKARQGNEAELPRSAAEILITRRRYDRLAAVVMPLSLAADFGDMEGLRFPAGFGASGLGGSGLAFAPL